MELKTFFAQGLNGPVIPGAVITVYAAGTTTLSTGLQDAEGSALSNPFNADGQGKVVLAAPDGDYDIKVEGAGRTTTIRVRFIDASSLAPAIASIGANLAASEAAAASADTARDEAVSAKDIAVAAAATTASAVAAVFIDLASPADGDGSEMVAFMPGGTGAQATTVEEKLRRKIDLLDKLTDAEKADVLSGANTIDLTAKIAQLFAEATPGAIIDARCLHGTVTWTANPFAGIPSLPAVFQTGKVKIRCNFNAFNLRMPSHFEWNWAGTTIAPTVKIESIPADNTPAIGMVDTYLSGGTCSGTSGGNTLTLNSAAGVYEGCAIGIVGVNAYAPLTHTLGVGISSSDPSFTFGESTTSTINSSLVYLKIDSEIMRVLVTAGTAAVQARGLFGTTAAAHLIGAPAVVMTNFIATVVSLSGLTATIKETLPITFTSAPFRAGAVDARITGWGEIDGEYNPADPPANIWHALASTLGRSNYTGPEISVKRAVHGGLMLFGAQDCTYNLDSIKDCGNVAASLGGSLWVFAQASNNVVNVREIKDCTNGPLFDNKSSGVSAYGLEGDASGNTVHIKRVTGVRTGYDITGCNNNALTIDYLSASDETGGIFSSGSQVVVPPTITGNSINIGYEATVRLPTGDQLAGNQIVIGGDRMRRRMLKLTLTGNVFPAADSESRVTFVDTAFLVKAGDLVTVAPVLAIQANTHLYGFCPADNQITIVMMKNGAGAANFLTGTEFRVEVSGPLAG